MGRQINGKWYNRSWIEGTKAEGEKELARWKTGSPHLHCTLVAEVLVNRETGKQEKIYSIFTRPRKFKNATERASWDRHSKMNRSDDRKDAKHGKSPHYIKLAR